jgi:hypothetical protein
MLDPYSNYDPICRDSGHGWGLPTLLYATAVAGDWAACYLERSAKLDFYLGCLGPIAGLFILLLFVRGSKTAAEDLEHWRFMNGPARYLYADVPKFARSKLNGRETVHGIYREHPLALLKPSWWIGVSLVLGAAAGFGFGYAHFVAGLAFATSSLLLPTWFIWQWTRSILLVTSERLLAGRGILSPQLNAMDKSKLSDVNFSMPGISTTLARLRIIRVPFGTITFSSAGSDHPLKSIPYLKGANEVFTLISLVCGKGGISPDATTIAKAIAMSSAA